MTRKVKVGAIVVGSFVALIGGMYGVKMLTGGSVAPKLSANGPSNETTITKGNNPEPTEKNQKSNITESPLNKSIGDNNESKLKVQPVTLGLDSDLKKKEEPQKLDSLPSMESLSLNSPEKKPEKIESVQFEAPKKLPDSVRIDPNLQQVQNVELDPMKKDPMKKEEKIDPLGLPSLDDIGKTDPNKKETQPIGLDPIDKETPKATQLQLRTEPVQNKEKEKPITVPEIGLNEPKTNPTNLLKKDELKGLDPIGGLEDNSKEKEKQKPVKGLTELDPVNTIKTDHPPKKEEPKGIEPIGGLEFENGSKKKEQPQNDPLKSEPTIKLEMPPKKESDNQLLLEEPNKSGNKPNPVETEPKIKPTEIRIPDNDLTSSPKQENKEISTIKIDTPTNKTPVDLERNIYDEDLYRLTANDRTTPELFRRLSEKYYQEVDYFGALTLYNRENPAGGGTIRIPPIEVLEKRYPNYIGKGNNRTIQMTSGSSPAVQNEPPPLVFKNPLENFPVYTVEGNGETLREIAERKLGNQAYWKNIKDLNVSLNENERIPAGTKLYLPLSRGQ